MEAAVAAGTAASEHHWSLHIASNDQVSNRTNRSLKSVVNEEEAAYSRTITVSSTKQECRRTHWVFELRLVQGPASVICGVDALNVTCARSYTSLGLTITH